MSLESSGGDGIGGWGALTQQVLLVESDAWLGGAVAALLAAAGLRVRRAEGGRLQGPADAIVVDIGDRDPYAVVREVALRGPSAPILAIAEEGASETVLAAIRGGAQGFLLRRDVARRLLPALDELREGGAPLSCEAAKAVISSLQSEERPPESGVHERCVLTPREHDVLCALARGLTYGQVAAVLDVSVNTVRTRVKSIYEKLGASTRTEAVLTAMQRGMLSVAG